MRRPTIAGMTIEVRLSGRDLRLLRVSHDVRVSEIAAVYPCSRQRITQIEGQRRVTERLARRYLAALARAEGEV
jgi:hypothetical protein